MNKKLFQDYAKLQMHLAKLEAEKTLLKSEILEEMAKSKVDKAETDYGIFTHAIRTSFQYTEAVKKLEEKVKIAKVKEEQKGLAKQKETDYLVYTPIK